MVDDSLIIGSTDDQHREIFMRDFTEPYCPRRNQFAFEYELDEFKPKYFPGGCLHRIVEI
jgi:hypothetical protein